MSGYGLPQALNSNPPKNKRMFFAAHEQYITLWLVASSLNMGP